MQLAESDKAHQIAATRRSLCAYPEPYDLIVRNNKCVKPDAQYTERESHTNRNLT
jgi:hypothetical protein